MPLPMAISSSASNISDPDWHQERKVKFSLCHQSRVFSRPEVRRGTGPDNLRILWHARLQAWSGCTLKTAMKLAHEGEVDRVCESRWVYVFVVVAAAPTTNLR
ncbi:hypothetical protein GOP47_0002284 [Adiantum capillus-veneris]|uniref:Uncharacterized protein n=1 Tax=Adiantum capillus-veneris TaxID=13818 RepID=A0A9D4ZQU8_ADICA|nr:hypothetical protein GOP47_0002284 [Adiantum capillus-veneris]